MKRSLQFGFVLALALSALPAFAGASLPAHLECDDLSGRLGTFHVLDINKGETGFWIDRDARGQGIKTGRVITIFYANNGCDNNFELRLSTRALRGLAAGRLYSIKGRLIYSDADTQYDFPGQEEIRTTVECRDYDPTAT